MGAGVSQLLGVEEFMFPSPVCSYTSDDKNLIWFPSPGGSVPAFVLHPPGRGLRTQMKNGQAGKISPVLLLYFHANACDIGNTLCEVTTLSDFLGASVMTPEYPGYGLLSSFRPSTRGIDAIASAAWEYATRKGSGGLGFSPNQVILMGRSIGTGPTTALAAELSVLPPERRPGGVILFAPFTNLRDLCDTQVPVAKMLMPPVWDSESNIVTAGDLPLLVVHGEDDEIIPVKQGRALYNCSQTVRKAGFFPKKLGHCQWNSASSMRVIQRWLRTYIQEAPIKFMSEALPQMPKDEAIDPNDIDPADIGLATMDPSPPVQPLHFAVPLDSARLMQTPRAVHGVLEFIQDLDDVHVGLRRPRPVAMNWGRKFPPPSAPPRRPQDTTPDFPASLLSPEDAPSGSSVSSLNRPARSQMHPLKGSEPSLRDACRSNSAPALGRGRSQRSVQPNQSASSTGNCPGSQGKSGKVDSGGRQRPAGPYAEKNSTSPSSSSQTSMASGVCLDV